MKFPVLPGEEEELVNPGFYGKALCLYLIDKLKEKGWEFSFMTAEDWGWWLEMKISIQESTSILPLCIYCAGNPTEYVCSPPDVFSSQWSWQKFRFIDVYDPFAEKLQKNCISIFNEDSEIDLIGVFAEMPF